MTCKCKVGSCGDCGASCRRCGCACDGVSPEVALARRRGHRGRGKSARPSWERTPPPAKVLKVSAPFTDDLEDTEEVWTAFGFTPAMKKKLPSKNDRQHGTADSDSPGWRALRQRMVDANATLAKILYPGDPQALLSETGKKLCNTRRRFDAHMSMVGLVVDIAKKSKRGSKEGRVAKAILAKTRGIRATLKSTWNLHFRGKAEHRAYDDFNSIMNTGAVPISKTRRARYSESDVRTAVDFILAPETTGTLSWGVRTVKLGVQDYVQLPCLTRRMSKKDMYRMYTQSTPAEKQISRMSFYRLAKTILHGAPKLLRAVDYMTGELVHDTVELLQEVVDVFGGSKKDEFSRQLELLRNFLKVQYDHHVSRDDGVATHGLQRALGKTAKGGSGEATTSSSSGSGSGGGGSGGSGGNNCDDSVSGSNAWCAGCAFVPYVVQQLQALVTENCDCGNSEDALRVIKDAEKKMRLYQGHRARVCQQRQALQKVRDTLVEQCAAQSSTATAIVTMDFKMKFEETSSRETTKEHFAKRGMSWHGCLITFYKSDRNGTVTQHNVYLDQILEGGNEQSVVTVMGLLEAALKWIRQFLPDVTNVVLQSDNAKCYNNNLLRLFICLLNTRGQITIVRYIFSETQDGKCTLSELHWPTLRQHCQAIACCQKCKTALLCVTVLKVLSMLTSRKPWRTYSDSCSTQCEIVSAPF